MYWANLISSIGQYEINLYDEIEKACNKIYFVFNPYEYKWSYALYFSYDKNKLLELESVNYSQIHNTYTHYPKFRNGQWRGKNCENCYMKYPIRKQSDINLLNEMKEDLENMRLLGESMTCIKRDTSEYQRPLCSY